MVEWSVCCGLPRVLTQTQSSYSRGDQGQRTIRNGLASSCPRTEELKRRGVFGLRHPALGCKRFRQPGDAQLASQPPAHSLTSSQRARLRGLRNSGRVTPLRRLTRRPHCPISSPVSSICGDRSTGRSSPYVAESFISSQVGADPAGCFGPQVKGRGVQTLPDVCPADTCTHTAVTRSGARGQRGDPEQRTWESHCPASSPGLELAPSRGLGGQRRLPSPKEVLRELQGSAPTGLVEA